jgi:hypothetical protein
MIGHYVDERDSSFSNSSVDNLDCSQQAATLFVVNDTDFQKPGF